MTATTLPPDVVAAICRHMNDDHAQDSLLICRTLGGRPDARHAEAVDVDSDGMRFRITAAGHDDDITVAFATPAPERAQVRGAVIELHERALRLAR